MRTLFAAENSNDHNLLFDHKLQSVRGKGHRNAAMYLRDASSIFDNMMSARYLQLIFCRSPVDKIILVNIHNWFVT